MSSEPAHAEQSRAFARRVLSAFQAAGRSTDTEVAGAEGPSDSYMTQLRNAANEGAWVPKPRRHTQKRIEAAANWGPGSAAAVWDGKEPTVLTTKRPASQLDRVIHDPAASPIERLKALVERNIAELEVEAEKESRKLVDAGEPDRAARVLADVARIAVDLRWSADRAAIDLDYQLQSPQPPPDRDAYTLAADEDDLSIEDEQGHDEHP